MKLRSRTEDNDGAFDGLTMEDIRRIRGAAAASITPGLEGLAGAVKVHGRERITQSVADVYAEAPKRRKGRRA